MNFNTGAFQEWHCKRWNLPSAAGQLSLAHNCHLTVFQVNSRPGLCHLLPGDQGESNAGYFSGITVFGFFEAGSSKQSYKWAGTGQNPCLTEAGDKILTAEKPGQDT